MATPLMREVFTIGKREVNMYSTDYVQKITGKFFNIGGICMMYQLDIGETHYLDKHVPVGSYGVNGNYWHVFRDSTIDVFNRWKCEMPVLAFGENVIKQVRRKKIYIVYRTIHNYWLSTRDWDTWGVYNYIRNTPLEQIDFDRMEEIASIAELDQKEALDYFISQRDENEIFIDAIIR